MFVTDYMLLIKIVAAEYIFVSLQAGILWGLFFTAGFYLGIGKSNVRE